MKLTGFPFPLGNPTIVILVLFLGGVQLISVGILGEYIGRIYEEVKARPRFIVEDAVGFDGRRNGETARRRDGDSRESLGITKVT
jgi:dolichol-phosphate mannosyltransferase